MPKSRLPPKKVQDFKKVKAKVGKKAPVASSNTNTKFKTKAIVMPEQTVVAQKTEPITSRHLSLTDLRGRTKHYNVTMRKDALIGMREYFQLHPHLLAADLGVTIDHVLPSMLDEERPVRNACLQLLHMILSAEKIAAVPFLRVIVVFLSSAMSHLQKSVRADTVKLLKLMLDTHTEYMWEYAPQILPGLIAIVLNRDSKPADAGTSQQNPGSTDARGPPGPPLAMEITRRLLCLWPTLSQILCGTKGTTYLADILPGTVSRPYGDTAPFCLCRGLSQVATQTAMLSSLLSEKPKHSKRHSHLSLSDLRPKPLKYTRHSKASQQTAILDTAPPSNAAQHACQQLVPFLIRLWVEAEPKTLANTALLCETADLLRVACAGLVAAQRELDQDGPQGPSPVREFYQDISRHIVPVFPLRANKPTQFESVCTANVRLIQTLSTLQPFTAQDSHWVASVTNYLDAEIQAGASSTPAYLLPDIFSQLRLLLPSLNQEQQIKLVSALCKCLLESHPRSATRKHCLTQAALILEPGSSLPAAVIQQAKIWLPHIPQMLLGAGSTDSSLSFLLLQLLLRACARDPEIFSANAQSAAKDLLAKESSKGEQSESGKKKKGTVKKSKKQDGKSSGEEEEEEENEMDMKTALACFFVDDKKTGKAARGPFFSLPLSCQELACSVLFYLPEHILPLRQVARCCRISVLPVSLRARLLDAVCARVGAGKIAAGTLLSFLVSCVIGDAHKSGGCDAVLRQVTHQLTTLCLGDSAIRLLAPLLCSLLKSHLKHTKTIMSLATCVLNQSADQQLQASFKDTLLTAGESAGPAVLSLVKQSLESANEDEATNEMEE